MSTKHRTQQSRIEVATELIWIRIERFNRSFEIYDIVPRTSDSFQSGEQFIGLKKSIKTSRLDYRDTNCPGRGEPRARNKMNETDSNDPEKNRLTRSAESVKIIRVGASSATPRATGDK